jgi:hypothetical protein
MLLKIQEAKAINPGHLSLEINNSVLMLNLVEFKISHRRQKNSSQDQNLNSFNKAKILLQRMEILKHSKN